MQTVLNNKWVIIVVIGAFSCFALYTLYSTYVQERMAEIMQNYVNVQPIGMKIKSVHLVHNIFPPKIGIEADYERQDVIA